VSAKLIIAGYPLIAMFVAVLGQADGLEKVAGYGLLTGILAWFMRSADQRLRAIEHNLNGMRRTILIDVLARSSDSAVRRAVREELRRVDPDLADEIEVDGRNGG